MDANELRALQVALAKSPTVIDGIRPRKLSSHRTRRRREMDSNFRFRMREAGELSFRFLSMSPKLSAF